MTTNEFLTTRQVQDLLKVDRITVYRMLNDGRLKAVKIGQQWRFALEEVEKLLSGKVVEPEMSNGGNRQLPVHCIQTIQDLFCQVSQTGAVTIDPQGEPITEPTVLNPFCRLVLANKKGAEACHQSWKDAAHVPNSGKFTCHAGLVYMTRTIKDGNDPAGIFLGGQVLENGTQELAKKTTANLGLEQEKVSPAMEWFSRHGQQTIDQLPGWTQAFVSAIQSILQERSGLMQRLEHIAKITQFAD